MPAKLWAEDILQIDERGGRNTHYTVVRLKMTRSDFRALCKEQGWRIRRLWAKGHSARTMPLDAEDSNGSLTAQSSHIGADNSYETLLFSETPVKQKQHAILGTTDEHELDDGTPPPVVINVHISRIRWGDTVLIDGVEKTVGKNDIKHGGFSGDTLFGDSCELGRRPVQKVVPHIEALSDPNVRNLRQFSGPKLDTKTLAEFIELRQARFGMKGDELYWRYRDPHHPIFDNPAVPNRYRATCHLFNKKFANERIEGPSFICCGVEYVARDVMDDLRAFVTR